MTDTDAQSDTAARGAPPRLRAALAANAAFSAVAGALLLVGGAPVAAALGALPSWLLTATGGALLAFSALVGWVALRPRVGWATAISLLDLGWVAGTVPLTLVPGLLTPAGAAAVLMVAAAVGAFAAAQLSATRTLLREIGGAPGRYRHCVRVATPVPAAAMWDVVADLGSIQRYSTSLARSALRGGGTAGVGAVRDCANRKDARWSEEVTHFDPAGRRLTLRFLTEAPDFPFPVSAMSGGWRVEDAGAGSTVEVWWSLTPATRLGWIVIALMTVPLDREIAAVIGRMAEAAAQAGTGGPAPRAGRRGRARRLTLAYC